MNLEDAPTFALQKELLRRLRPESRGHYLAMYALAESHLMTKRNGLCTSPAWAKELVKERAEALTGEDDPWLIARDAVDLAGLALWVAVGIYGPEEGI